MASPADPPGENGNLQLRHDLDDPTDTDSAAAPDAFESREDHEESVEPMRASIELDDLPIELISLTDR